ncbi:MAG: glycosyltransferase family 2 protein [Candidatus Aenigmarchaeota archaeon]|nr:glycosyltransferase family 2 protein [Candidatus Aenigmarchaeota archaeon]
MKNVGILLPAYNEEKNIATVVREARRFLPSSKVVVVDDGSKDGTGKIARKEGAFVVAHSANRGKGEALRTGLDVFNRKFRGVKYIIVADADRQYAIKEAPNLLKPLLRGEADFVMGKRDFSKIPFRHRLGNWVWRTAFNAMFKTNFSDTNCGFIAMTKATANKVVSALGGGYIIENALLIEAIRNNLAVRQVGVSVDYRKTSAVPRGLLMVAGVLVFIFKNGIRYSFRKMKK